MDTMYFPNGYVGFKLTSLQDVVKAQTLGLAVCNENNDYFEEYVIGEDENGEETERKPTQEEIFERLQNSMQAGEKLYATFDLDCGKVVPIADTTLQSDFSIGQKVYIMHRNKIKELVVAKVMLVSDTISSKIKDDIGLEIKSDYVRGNEKVTFEENALLLAEATLWANGNGYNYSVFGVYGKSDVFQSKEELAQHLLNEQ